MLAVISCSPLIGNLPLGIQYNKQLQVKGRLPIRGEHDITASITREKWNTI
jgi:hypothetical protein